MKKNRACKNNSSIKAFEQAGGIGILMDNPQNVINKLSDLLEEKNMIQEGIIDNMKSKNKRLHISY